ncbi:transglycosylase family protein [Streptomyces sp. CA-111067]|uniref:transglycosylase family protein n=1 Tax=Streptomyces sp. CA-111067 TaxID=3240046 RepID=UPI003D96778B
MLSSGNGKHRRPRQAPAAMAAVAATGAGIALPLLGAGAAHAADATTWDRVAVCETGGQWHADPGSGFYGGLAITQDTWEQYGGTAYAQRPDLATSTQQIAVAERILSDLGPDAWPGCETLTGLLASVTTPPAADQPGTGTSAGTGTSTGSTTGASGGTTTPSTTPSDPTDPIDPGAPTTPVTPPVTDPTTPVTPPSTTPGAPTTPVTPPPATGTTTPPSTDPTDPASPGTGTGDVRPPGQVDPGGPDSTDPLPAPDPSAGSGKHARPYSPTDEELAAADRASRTEVLGMTGRPGSTDDGKATAPVGSGKHATGPTAPSRYTVGSGDSLAGIARSQHVDGGWQHLYAANKQAIGTDPNVIKPGQILTLG